MRQSVCVLLATINQLVVARSSAVYQVPGRSERSSRLRWGRLRKLGSRSDANWLFGQTIALLVIEAELSRWPGVSLVVSFSLGPNDGEREREVGNLFLYTVTISQGATSAN